MNRFIHVDLAGQAATRELLQRYRTEAHIAIRKRLGVNLFYTDALGDTVSLVTKKSDKHQGDWILTGDIKVRFPNKRAADTTYEQHRNKQNNRETHAARVIGHSGQVCPTLIPRDHSGETSQDDSLNKAFIACPAFRGKVSNCINRLFRDILHEIYDRLYDIDAEPMDPPRTNTQP